jgi:hypothetical protein
MCTEYILVSKKLLQSCVTEFNDALRSGHVKLSVLYTRRILCCAVFLCIGPLFVEIYLKASYFFILCSLFRSSG